MDSTIRDNIEAALKAGKLDGASIAEKYGVTRDVVAGIRVGVQAMMQFNGEGLLPVVRLGRPELIADSDEEMRAYFENNLEVKLETVAEKFGESVYRTRKILSRPPNLLAGRAKQQQAEIDSLFARLMPLIIKPKGLAVIAIEARMSTVAFGNLFLKEKPALFADYQLRLKWNNRKINDMLPYDCGFDAYKEICAKLGKDDVVFKDGRYVSEHS